MCLEIKKDQKAKIATKDIICYKVLYKTADSKKLYTPYQSKLIKIGNEYTSKIITKNRIFIDVIEQALHTYSNLKDIKHNLNFNNVIAKCIIPKGSTYYKGIYYTYNRKSLEYTQIYSYASDKLIYKELIHVSRH